MISQEKCLKQLKEIFHKEIHYLFCTGSSGDLTYSLQGMATVLSICKHYNIRKTTQTHDMDCCLINEKDLEKALKGLPHFVFPSLAHTAWVIRVNEKAKLIMFSDSSRGIDGQIVFSY